MKNRRSQLLLFSLASLAFFIAPLLGMEKRRGNKKHGGIQKEPVIRRKRTPNSVPSGATNTSEITLEDALLLIGAQRRKINNLKLQIVASNVTISNKNAKQKYISTELSRVTSLLVQQQLKIVDLSNKPKRVEHYGLEELIKLTTAAWKYMEQTNGY